MPRQPKRTKSKIARSDTVHHFDEKVVAETDRTVPVEPVKRSRQARQPIPEPALDHRRQIVGTDEPRGRTRK
jgi:hypothetical protein